MKVPRHAIYKESINVQLYEFFDALEDAYEAWINMQTKDEEGNVLVSLIFLKSRVASEKPRTILTLELCGALQSAKLDCKVGSASDLPIDNAFYWCDLTILWFWLRMQLNSLEIFEPNSVDRI